jgi:carbon storage regulator
MLVLQRKFGEKILIGDDIVIEITYLDRGRVRLGITAPPDVRIDREELRQRIEDEGANGGEK